MAVKKTQLYASLWASCDKLRGGMDSSEYKDYILTLLFMKYVTDKFKNILTPQIRRIFRISMRTFMEVSLRLTLMASPSTGKYFLR